MLESQADRTTRTRSASLDEANNCVRSTETQRGGKQARVFGKPLASMPGDFASVLALLQNPVEFLDVGRFWKVVVEPGLFEYCLVRPGSIAGNGD